MSTNSFFVAEQVNQDISIETHIEYIKKEIQYYTQDINTLMKEINSYTSPEIGAPIIEQCDCLQAGIVSHTIRLDTLEKIKNNQPVLQDDLDLLLLMPVFATYEKYSNVVNQISGLTQGF